MPKTTKPRTKKGNTKVLSDKDTTKNPLLHIDPSSAFSISVGNMFDDQTILINPDYVNFNPADKSSLNPETLNQKSEFLVILRYYEYIVSARFCLSYIYKLWVNGEKTGDITFEEIFSSVEHRLKNELYLRVPSFEDIQILDFKVLHKIKY